MTVQQRAWVYRSVLAVSALLVAYGVLGEGEAAQWAVLAAALLGIGTDGLAVRHTPTERPD